MTTLTLGKVKFVNRGAWSASATYTQGDIVTHNGNSYVYKNETPKQYTSLIMGGTGGGLTSGTFNGTIASLTANSTTLAITSSGSSSYLVDGIANPPLNLQRGLTYTLNINSTGHPFWIKTAQVTGTGSAYNKGVTNNGIDSGTITFQVPLDAPDTLYYICQFHGTMTGVINITGTGKGISNSTFTVTWDVPLQATNDNRIVANGNHFAYAAFIEPDSKIISISNTNTTTSVISISKQTTNISTQTSVPVTIGTRRMSGKYEVALNNVDWDALSEGITFKGLWAYATHYLPGDLVVRNNNSYLCIHGVQQVDPLFDYIGCWEPYLIGDDAFPHQRIVTPVNANPWGWNGHPYIKKPTWGNATIVNATAMIPGTTYRIAVLGTTNFTNHGAARNVVGEEFICTSVGTGTGTTAATYSGIPWFIPATHKHPVSNNIAQASPFWNTPSPRSYMDYRGVVDLGSDGRGHKITKGHQYYGSSPGQYKTMFGAAENAPQFLNDWYSGDVPHYGNQPFEWNFQRVSAPKLTQNIHKWTVRKSLTSYGSVLVQGTSANGGSLGGEDADFASPAMELGRESFNNRAIVKLGIPDASRDGSDWQMALDEYGELWTWGYNGYGQCGIGPENHLATGYRLANRTDNVRSPMCLTKEIFFEGNRIVDIFQGHNHGYALDELGQLWGWGRNNYGQLGFQSATGFANTAFVSAPFKIPVTWGTFGGIQKIAISSTENEDWIVILTGDGHVWTQGYNNVGQLGKNSTTSDTNATGTITRTSSVSGWSIGGGIKNIWTNSNNNPMTFFLDTSLQLWGCGYNAHNQFGSSDVTNRLVPTQMFGPQGAMTNIVGFGCSGRAGGGSQMCLDHNGIAYGLGWNGYGETGTGHVTNHVGTNNNPQIQFGASSTSRGWLRVIMPSDRYAIGNRTMDIWGYGDYEAATGHNTNHYYLSERGEILQTGRSYNYSNSQGNVNYGNYQLAPVDVTNFS
jgi:alpha-tubulin suppressor-like RCC1 family protein